MSYPIEYNIPIPKIKSNKQNRYPFRDMKIGSSFFVSCEESGTDMQTLKRRISSSINSAGLRLEREFILREVKNGVRIWRIK